MVKRAEHEQVDVAQLAIDGVSVAIIDIDGTVSESNIGNLYFFLKKNELPTLVWAVWYLYFVCVKYPYYFLLDKRNRALAQQKIYALYSHYDQAYLNQMSERLFNERLSQRIFPEAVALIERLQASDLPIIFLSTNLDPIICQYARHFGVSQYYAIPLDKICGIVADLHFFSRFKAEMFKEIKGSCDALVVADSKSDLPILRRAKIPVIATKKVRPWMGQVERAKYLFIGR